MNATPAPRQPASPSQQPSSSQRPAGPTPQGRRAAPPQRRAGTPTADPGTEPPERLVSLDAYRGFIMIMLAAAGFGVHQLTQLPAEAPVWQHLDYDIWQQVGVHFEHPVWDSQIEWVGVAFWDLIQPAFMFMVGVAMPFSFARRASLGHTVWRRSAHAVWRAVVLVLLGVFLSSNWSTQTNWTFVNVLSQIGLGYLFVYALLGRRFWVQLLAFVVILAGYWGFFYGNPPSNDYDYAAVNASEEAIFTGNFAPWSKNANAGHEVDKWLLNQFPRPEEDTFKFNDGGYVTLNFIPSIATMLLGVFCGQLLISEQRWWQKFLLLVVGGAICLGLGVLAGEYACPIVKRIWTPSWVLFSGGWVIWMLAAFYLVFDLCRLRWLAFPLVVVGMNSIAMYVMGQLLRPWATKTVEIHFLGLLQRIELRTGVNFLADNMFGLVLAPTMAFIVFWLIAFWMYRQKFFVKI